jgi:hypothetical protein
MKNAEPDNSTFVFRADVALPKIDFLTGSPDEMGPMMMAYCERAQDDGMAAVLSTALVLPDGRLCVQMSSIPPTDEQVDGNWSRAIIRELVARIDDDKDAVRILDVDMAVAFENGGPLVETILARFCADVLDSYTSRVKAESNPEPTDDGPDDTPDDQA